MVRTQMFAERPAPAAMRTKRSCRGLIGWDEANVCTTPAMEDRARDLPSLQAIDSAHLSSGVG